jgi:hypothetical protein
MQPLAAMKPIWQGVLSAAITIAVGLLLLFMCYRALSRPIEHEPGISEKIGRNVEWQTWTTTVDILTRGAINRDAATLVFNLIPEQLGGPTRT